MTREMGRKKKLVNKSAVISCRVNLRMVLNSFLLNFGCEIIVK